MLVFIDSLQEGIVPLELILQLPILEWRIGRGIGI